MEAPVSLGWLDDIQAYFGLGKTLWRSGQDSVRWMPSKGLLESFDERFFNGGSTTG